MALMYWKTIAHNLSKAGWSWGCVSALDCEGRTIWIVDAHGYGKRFIVRADEMLTAFVELQRAIQKFAVSLDGRTCFDQLSPVTTEDAACFFQKMSKSLIFSDMLRDDPWLATIKAYQTPADVERHRRQRSNMAL
jgi:hypothetical protein